MKTPQSKVLDKDGKAQKKTTLVAAKAVAPLIPGFGMASLSMKSNGTYVATIKCINGDPRRTTTNNLPAGITYYGGRERIPGTAEVVIYLPDGANIDTNFIFPWSTNQDDPLRMGGGIIKGILTEGAQRVIDPTVPLESPIMVTDWVNGTPWRTSAGFTGTFGLTLFDGNEVFGLILMDRTTGRYALRAMAMKEGGCLDRPA